jgi:copper chaperone
MIDLDVTGMSCGGCAASVTKAIQRFDAAAKVDVDLTTGRVRVDGQVTLEQAIAAVEAAGFGAAPAKSD